MGTSKSFGGAKGTTPLIPSWLPSDEANPFLPDINPILPRKDDIGDAPKEKPIVTPSTVIPGNNSRFKQPRTNFTRYASSSGKDSAALKNGLSSYVKKSYGGAKQASARMSASKTTARKLASFFIDVSKQGFQATLQKYNLSKLQKLSLEQACDALADEFCKFDGKIDTAISRDAFIFTMQELENANMLDKLEKPDDATILFMLKNFMALSIKNRLIEDVGQSIFLSDKEPATIQSMETQITDYIKMTVEDAIIKFQEEFIILDLMNEIDNLYESSYQMLELIANEEKEEQL